MLRLPFEETNKSTIKRDGRPTRIPFELETKSSGSSTVSRAYVSSDNVVIGRAGSVILASFDRMTIVTELPRSS